MMRRGVVIFRTVATVLVFRERERESEQEREQERGGNKTSWGSVSQGNKWGKRTANESLTDILNVI